MPMRPDKTNLPKDARIVGVKVLFRGSDWSAERYVTLEDLAAMFEVVTERFKTEGGWETRTVLRPASERQGKAK